MSQKMKGGAPDFATLEAQQRQAERAGEKAHPIATGLGMGVGAIPETLLLPQARAAQGAGLLSRAGASALTGATQAATIQAGLNSDKPLKQRLLEMGVAGLGGGALGTLAPAAAAGIPNTGRSAPGLLDRAAERAAVRSTYADRAALKSVGMGKKAPNAAQKASETGRFLLDEGVPLRSPKAIQTALQDIIETEGPRLRPLTQQADSVGVKVKLADVADEVLNSPQMQKLYSNTETRAGYDHVASFLEDQVAQKGWEITPTQAHEIRMMVGANSKFSKDNPTVVAQAFKEAYGHIDDALGSAMQDAGVGKDWALANSRFHLAKTAKTLADTGVERRSGNALLSPSEKGSGILGAGMALMGEPVSGLALAGGTALLRRYGMPTTARTLNALSSSGAGAAPSAAAPYAAAGITPAAIRAFLAELRQRRPDLQFAPAMGEENR
jgi:hypothetical protein